MQIRVVHLISKIDRIKRELEEIQEIKKRLHHNRNYSKRIYKALEAESMILERLHKKICSQAIKTPLPPHLETLVKKEIEKSKRTDAHSSADTASPTLIRPTVYLPTQTKEEMIGHKVNQKPTFTAILKTESPSRERSTAKDSPTEKSPLKESPAENPSLKDSSAKKPSLKESPAKKPSLKENPVEAPSSKAASEESQIVELVTQNRAGIEEMVEQKEREKQEEKKQLASDRGKKDFPFTFE